MILQRIAIWVLKGSKGQLNVKLFPAQEASMDQLDAVNLRKTGILKPWKLFIRQKVLFASHIQPNTVR